MAQRKPTKAELEYARLRSTAAGLPSTTTKKQLKGTSKRIIAGAVVAANITPTGRAASTIAKYASASKATKLSSGASKIKTKKFTQGDRARVTNTPPKKSGVGKNSPIKGTKVEVKYKTKELSPKQQANLTVGRTVREGSKKVGTYIKGAVTGAYVTNEVKNAKARRDAEKKKKGN
jgi:hypothetical protein